MIYLSRHPELVSGSYGFKIPTFVGMTMLVLLLCFPTFADEKAEEPQTEEVTEEAQEAPEQPVGYHSPEFCDFEITFPEKPNVTRHCPKGTRKCYQLTNYTYVYDMATTLEVSAYCTRSKPENFTQYSEEVIRIALSGMLKKENLDQHDITTATQEDMLQGSLLGTGTYGKQSMIYNAQLWIGENSALTVEAKLIGNENQNADAAFGDIMSSIQVKDK